MWPPMSWGLLAPRRLFAVLLMAASTCGPSAFALPASVAAPVEEGVSWQRLTSHQREALAPLQSEWPKLDAPRKRKWLEIADRYKTLSPAERLRISARMTEWSRLTPSERGEVRLRYEEAKQLPTNDRRARWRDYQELSDEEKSRLAQQAALATTPAAGQRTGSSASGRRTAGEPSVKKSNVVPNPTLSRPPRPVSPTIVQAAPGATTRPITRPASPPAHQQTGMPKIATSPEFVNRSTLLPKRGPQAAAVSFAASMVAPASAPTPTPAPAPTSTPVSRRAEPFETPPR